MQSQREPTFTSSFHVNFWHFGLVVLPTKSRNGEVDGAREIESSKLLPHVAELLWNSAAPIPPSILLPVFICLNSPFSWIISPGVISSSSLMTHKSDDDFLKHIFQHLSQVGLHVLARAGEEGEMESLLDAQIALSLMCSLPWEHPSLLCCRREKRCFLGLRGALQEGAHKPLGTHHGCTV